MTTGAVGTLLMVDDEADTRKIAVRYAEALGFKVFEADDGLAALDILKSESPDVIISDMKMPGKDGLDLLKDLRDSGRQTPFLFLSAFTSKEYTIRALSLGAFDYLEKPFLPNEFKALLHEMLRVSKAQRGLPVKNTAPDSGDPESKTPDVEIMRISSLTIPAPGASQTPTPMDAQAKHDRLVKMFAAEVEHQLNHGLKALTNLKHTDSPGWELGYLFRLMYSIRSTASSLRLNEIRDLALALEQAYVMLRVRPAHLNKVTLANLRTAHDLLRRQIGGLNSEIPYSPEERSHLAEDSKHIIQDLKAIVSSK